MTIKFLGQGFENQSPNAVGNYLIKYFGDNQFHSFFGISAFASPASVLGFSSYINSAKKNISKMILIVGIDQDGTSKEALEQIEALNIDGYIFHQRETPIFHPKIYLFEGAKSVKIILGSSNLTGTGMFINIEGSVLIEFDVTDHDGVKLLNEIKTYYKTLFNLTDPNLFKINSLNINAFVAEGIVPDEATRKRMYNQKTAPVIQTNTTVNFAIPKRPASHFPANFIIKRASTTSALSTKNTGLTVIASTLTPAANNPVIIRPTSRSILWESGPLTERDLTIPKNANTNQTGSMLFKKGKTTGIDQKHYFRDTVFANLPWVFDTDRRTAHIERATGFFRIIIMGVDQGVFPLLVSHDSRTNSKTYLQNNSVTSVSWGSAKQLIAKPALLGKTATLADDPTQNNGFILEIK